jgi:hypothetical protein
LGEKSPTKSFFKNFKNFREIAVECAVKYSLFFWEKDLQKRKKYEIAKIALIAYNTKRNLRFSTFIS